MSEEALQIILGIVFAILGLAILFRLKKLTTSKYFKILFAFVALLLIGFGVYLAILSVQTS
ncbi:hypothetical protein [Cochleicola gelatinilyticus]|uniref:Uncharacterized protein n=1 Tax=Cochleicola gelatinilyticus TaxID=1763537 RepID=A0A167K7I8_9FLAO|nr:hypothetical protein [Cochleicola gelatinilyticus]OAB81468.1 hypothetical protein ULVI_01215 [Cochleicola gelatinilyticus]